MLIERLRSLQQGYDRLLRDRPYATNGLQGAVLGAAGDCIAQRLKRPASGSSSWGVEWWPVCTAAIVSCMCT